MGLTTIVVLVACLFWLALPARADAQVTLLPTSGPPGTVVTVVGTGFGANEMVTLCWGDVRCANSGRPVANSLGSFTAFFAVPEDPADYVVGENTVGACGRSTGDCAQTVFTVITGTTTLPPTTTTTTPTTTAPVDPTTTTTLATTTVTENPTPTPAPTTTTTAAPGDTTSTLPGASDTTVPPPPGSSTVPAAPPGGPDDTDPPGGTDDADSPGTASDPEDPPGTASDSEDTTVESEPASSLQPDPASSVPPATPPSLPPPEVLSRSLQSPEPVEEAGELLAPSSQARSSYVVSAAGNAADDSDILGGLSQIQWILLWFGTMVVFTIGVLIYDMRRRWKVGRG